MFGLVKCQGGSKCVNGGACNTMGGDTLVKGKKAWCSSCRPDWNSKPGAFDLGPFAKKKGNK